MANPVVVPGDLVVPGTLRLSGAVSPLKARSDVLSLNSVQAFTIPWTAWRIWDSLYTNLTTAGVSDDDLGLVGGTFATGSPSIQTGDCKAASKTRYARAQIALPWEYVAAETVTMRFHAGMITTVAGTSATLDLQCYETNKETGISADLCATAAQSINSITFADIDFTITATALSPGDLLDLRIAIAIVDAATGTAVIGCVGNAQLLCDVR